MMKSFKNQDLVLTNSVITLTSMHHSKCHTCGTPAWVRDGTVLPFFSITIFSTYFLQVGLLFQYVPVLHSKN